MPSADAPIHSAKTKTFSSGVANRLPLPVLIDQIAGCDQGDRHSHHCCVGSWLALFNYCFTHMSDGDPCC